MSAAQGGRPAGPPAPVARPAPELTLETLFRLDGSRALLVGGYGGIGEATTRLFAERAGLVRRRGSENLVMLGIRRAAVGVIHCQRGLRPQCRARVRQHWRKSHSVTNSHPQAQRKMARPAGVEPATFGSVDQRSIQLSYGRAVRLLEQKPDADKPANVI